MRSSNLEWFSGTQANTKIMKVENILPPRNQNFVYEIKDLDNVDFFKHNDTENEIVI